MSISFVTRSFPEDSAFDTAVSRALMLRVAAGELPETLRLARPGASVAFGKRDVVSPGYEEAAQAARDGGYAPIERLAGGRAAVFHEDTIELAHAIPDPDPRSGIDRRFEEIAVLLREALASLGIEARVGEVEGEYCPGAHSVNARGERKLVGVGQRLVAGAAHVGAVVVVDGADRVNDVLVPVYSALGLEWRPEVTGSVVDERPGTTWDAVVEAIAAGYDARHGLEPARVDRDTLELARRLASEHAVPVQEPAPAGRPNSMSHHDEEEEESSEVKSGVGPEKTHEATTPPGQGDLDEEAVEQAREKLDQAGR